VQPQGQPYLTVSSSTQPAIVLVWKVQREVGRAATDKLTEKKWLA